MLRVASTRDPERVAVSFDHALLRGLAPDGGLYVPIGTPELPAGWDEAGSLSEVAERVLAAWLGGDGRGSGAPDGAPDAAPDAASLRDLARDALSFPVPLVRLGGDRWVL